MQKKKHVSVRRGRSLDSHSEPAACRSRAANEGTRIGEHGRQKFSQAVHSCISLVVCAELRPPGRCERLAVRAAAARRFLVLYISASRARLTGWGARKARVSTVFYLMFSLHFPCMFSLV